MRRIAALALGFPLGVFACEGAIDPTSGDDAGLAAGGSDSGAIGGPEGDASLPPNDASGDDAGDSDSGGGSVASEWGYQGELGPQNWAALNPNYVSCGEGTEQSPIDLHSNVAPARHPALETDYHTVPLTIFNNGHTIEIEYHEGSTLTVDGHTWDVVQFHFHAHSEHTVDGVTSPLELHIVHRDETGGLAVVGVLIDEGAANPALASIFEHLPAEKGEPEEVTGVEINVADLLPADLAAWRYDGSLTTPPCSEGVRWHVLSTPIEASTEQIAAFTAIFDHNSRPVQPLNEREIEPAHFGYEGEVAAEHWAELSPAYATCEEGMEQSPIDLGPAVALLSDPALEFDYQSTPLVIFNNGHTVQVNYEEGSTLTVDGHTWEALQFHFHAHSEHTIEGGSMPLELHIVHRDSEGGLAVVGVFIAEGASNAALAAVFEHLPAEKGEPEEVAGVEINAADLLPVDLSAWRYDGSLTTPPCSEGVRWHVLSEPIEASPAQIAAFEAIVSDNFRPVQPLNDRGNAEL